jgi:hypothetical protein
MFDVGHLAAVDSDAVDREIGWLFGVPAGSVGVANGPFGSPEVAVVFVPGAFLFGEGAGFVEGGEGLEGGGVDVLAE